MKTWQLIVTIITVIILVWLIGFVTGQATKKCPPQNVVHVDTSIVINQPEIDRLQRWLNAEIKEKETYIEIIDSLEKIKKHETKIIYVDTVNIPTIFREWANYKAN